MVEVPSLLKWRKPSSVLVRATSAGFDGFLSHQNVQSCIRSLEDEEDDEEEEDGVSKVGGLIRSQSYPPQGWEAISREYVLSISSKSPQTVFSAAYHHHHHQHHRLHGQEDSAMEATSVVFSTVDALQNKENAIPCRNNNTGIDTRTLIHLSSSSSSSSSCSVQLAEFMSVDDQQQASSCPNEPSKSLNAFCGSAGCCPPSGKMLLRGRRKEMEDAVTILPTFTAIPCGTIGLCLCPNDSPNGSCHWNFFGVYDGHGGSQASSYCKQRLHILLADRLSSSMSAAAAEHDRFRWEEIMMDSFRNIDMEVGGVCPNGVCNDDLLGTTCSACKDAITPENVGTTAVVAVVGSCQMVIANCGDSRAVLSRGGKAIPLSTDQKPERVDETRRIESAGGSVIYWDGYRVGGFLALSRAIGDRYLKRYVISEPEVICVQREEEDECLILASDGLWDVISNDYACEVARRGLVSKRKQRGNMSLKSGEDPASTFVATFLTKLAYSRGSKDNISVIVVDLKR